MLGKNLFIALWSKNLKTNQNARFFKQINMYFRFSVILMSRHLDGVWMVWVCVCEVIPPPPLNKYWIFG